MSILPITIGWGGLTVAEGHDLFTVEEFGGWDDLPEVEDGSAPHVEAHGSMPGRLRMGSRVVTVSGRILGTPETVRARIAEVSSAWALSQDERLLTIAVGSDAQVAWARLTRRSFPGDRMQALGVPSWAVQFTCSDPRRYSASWSQGETGLAHDAPGVPWPWSWPITWPDGSASSGAVPTVNTGSVGSPARLLFAGPLTTPSVVIGGRRLEFGIELGADEALMVDARSGSARLVPASSAGDLWLLDVFPATAGADRSASVTSRSGPITGLVVPPGDSSAGFTAAAGSGQMRLAWRSASV